MFFFFSVSFFLQSVTVASSNHEKHLEEVLLLWQVYCQKFQLLDDWMDQAQGIMNDTDDDTPSLLRKHKVWFHSVSNNSFIVPSANELISKY